MAREKQGYRDALYKVLHRHDDEEDEQREARMRKEMIFLSLYSALLGTVALVLAVIHVLQRMGFL